jgi:hypothetical protein
MQIKNPNVIINHHNQSFDECAKSVECLTINVHFASDNPKPDNAPYRPKIEIILTVHKMLLERELIFNFTCDCMTKTCQ